MATVIDASSETHVASDPIPAVRELGLDVVEDAPLSPPVQLLWEGEQAYVFRLPAPQHHTVAQLSRTMVDGLVTGAPIALPQTAVSGSGP